MTLPNSIQQLTNLQELAIYFRTNLKQWREAEENKTKLAHIEQKGMHPAMYVFLLTLHLERIPSSVVPHLRFLPFTLLMIFFEETSRFPFTRNFCFLLNLIGATTFTSIGG